MTILSLILTILGVVEPMLSGAGFIPAQYEGLATGILNAIGAVKNRLTAPNAALDVTAVSLVQAIASGLSALETAKAIPASSGASLAVALANAVASGTAAYEAAGSYVNPSKLQPESLVR